MQFVYKKDQAKKIHKHGVDIYLYGEKAPSGFVYEETKEGHFQEWYDDESTYQWFVVEGSGRFVINDESYEVNIGDLIVVPPKNRIHYFGTMRLALTTTPRFDAKNEHEVRLIRPDEAQQ